MQHLIPAVLATFLFTGTMTAALAQSSGQQAGVADAPSTGGNAPPNDQDPSAHAREIERVSPVRRIGRDNNDERFNEPLPPGGIRTMDGSLNNTDDISANAAQTPLFRWLSADYSDGIAAMAGTDRPNPRVISNTVLAQESGRVNARGATDYLWQWGQFLDHDIDLTDGADPEEPASIVIPAGDSWFDPTGSGVRVLPFNRSLYVAGSGTSVENPRQQVNEITGWIDASNVYGSDAVRAEALRSNDGSGRLLTSEGNMLPFNVDALPNAGGDSDTLFLAGDVRANEQVGLTAMHTLFVREHNRLATQIAARDPRLGGEQIYQAARRIVAAQMQVITYREFLPLLLGPAALPPYAGYDPALDARIANSFSTAAYRLGHSLLSPHLLRIDAQGNEIAEGHLPLRRAFFAPQEISGTGLEPVLRGLAAQACQELDSFLVDDIRNFLFGAPGSNGFDLAALNIQRGRDHGLPSYNTTRELLGLGRLTSFAQVSSDQQVRDRLAQAYAHVDDIDLWVGGLAEDSVAAGMVGPTFAAILVSQFAALRDGDRYWYENTFSGRELRDLENTRLSDIIRRNTLIGSELPGNVFLLASQAQEQGASRAAQESRSR